MNGLPQFSSDQSYITGYELGREHVLADENSKKSMTEADAC